MCTIIAAVDVWPEAPLVVAANRDEALDRPASVPQVWPAGEVARRRVLAPRDLRAGGTWLGLNDLGLFVAITNRKRRPDPSRRSRGELVFTALGAASQLEAQARMRELDAREYNPFHLLLADRQGAVVVWADGESEGVHEVPLGAGVHWITERSFGAADSRRHQTLERVSAELRSGPLPDAARWRSVLSDHRPYKRPDQRPRRWTIGFDSLCVHARPFNYGTRSSTLVQLGREPQGARFLHANGRPCETEFVDYADAVEQLGR